MRHASSILLIFCLFLCSLAGRSCIGSPGRHLSHPTRPLKRSHKKAQKITAELAREAIRKKQQLASQLHGLRGHIAVVRAKIHATKVREHHLHVVLHVTKQQVDAARARLQDVSDRMSALEHQHQRVLEHLAATKKRLAFQRKMLAERIRENYMRGQISYAEVLLRAASVSDLLSRGVYVRQIVRSDMALINSVQRDIVQIQIDKRRLEAQEAQQQQLAALYERRKKEYLALQWQQEEALSHTVALRTQEEEELDELEGEAEAMTARIQFLSGLLEERRREEEAAWRAAHPNAPRRELRQAEEHFAIAPIWRGELIKPVNGVITSEFGMRYHPILHRYRMHTGVDIAAPEGTPIHAAGDGTVIVASYLNGYGYTVVIDHGRGLTTLYGHCSELLVHVGETVHQGQVIARVGATGLATGPHCHFEVRVDGKPVKPF
jgi:murein DD-endopeptidase MepM/ murein hydrolase activator NlpD